MVTSNGDKSRQRKDNQTKAYPHYGRNTTK